MSKSTDSLKEGFDFLLDLLRHPIEEKQPPITYLAGVGMWLLGLVSFGVIPAISARETEAIHSSKENTFGHPSQIGFALSCLCGVGLIGWAMIELYDAWQEWRSRKQQKAMGFDEIFTEEVRGENDLRLPLKSAVTLSDDKHKGIRTEVESERDSQTGLDIDFSSLPADEPQADASQAEPESEDPAQRRNSSSVLGRRFLSGIRGRHPSREFDRDHEQSENLNSGGKKPGK